MIRTGFTAVLTGMHAKKNIYYFSSSYERDAWFGFVGSLCRTAISLWLAMMFCVIALLACLRWILVRKALFVTMEKVIKYCTQEKTLIPISIISLHVYKGASFCVKVISMWSLLKYAFLSSSWFYKKMTANLKKSPTEFLLLEKSLANFSISLSEV